MPPKYVVIIEVGITAAALLVPGSRFEVLKAENDRAPYAAER
jgi:hypothetical protein